MAKQYAKDFCAALADEAREVAVSYLKAHDAPAELVEVVGNMVYVASGEYDDRVDLDGIIGPMTKNVAALGGEFHSSASMFGGNTPIPWPGK